MFRLCHYYRRNDLFRRRFIQRYAGAIVYLNSLRLVGLWQRDLYRFRRWLWVNRNKIGVNAQPSLLGLANSLNAINEKRAVLRAQVEALWQQGAYARAAAASR